MDQRQLFKRTVQHQYAGQFLFYASFTPDLDQRLRNHLDLDNAASFAEHFGMLHPVPVQPQVPCPQEPSPFWAYYSDYPVPPEAFINHLGVLEIPGSLYHFTQYVSPLRNAKSMEDLKAFPYPPAGTADMAVMQEQVAQAHREGRIAQCAITHMYEDAWQIRGYEPFLMDMVLQPAWCEYILDRLMERNVKRAAAAARAGVDLLHTGDDVANQKAMTFSVESWRRFIKPRWAEVYRTAKTIKPDISIRYHSDGDISPIIPELIDIGVNILNPVQPECLDPVWVKGEYGDQVVLDGTIGTQTTMPFGTPEEVSQTVRQRVETLGADGALILAPTHVLEPEVPLENVLAFVNEVRNINGL